jgi:hypothetical protein
LFSINDLLEIITLVISGKLVFKEVLWDLAWAIALKIYSKNKDTEAKKGRRYCPKSCGEYRSTLFRLRRPTHSSTEAAQIIGVTEWDTLACHVLAGA